MILQIDGRFSVEPEIQKYGCHYLAQLFVMNRRCNIELSTDRILDMYHVLKGRAASYQPPDRPTGDPLMVIGDRAEQNNPDDIITYFDLTYSRTARFEDLNYICTPDEQELIQYARPNWWHWVAGDGRGNVAYDPEGYSITVAQGHPVRKKIFSIIK